MVGQYQRQIKEKYKDFIRDLVIEKMSYYDENRNKIPKTTFSMSTNSIIRLLFYSLWTF